MDKTITISIIGSAGRLGTHKDITPKLYKDLVNVARNELKIAKEDGYRVNLVSGGAAFCDHIAVTLYLQGECDGLHLHLPSDWMGNQYGYDHYGRTSNQYHELFSTQVGFKSLSQIQEAVKKGCVLTTHKDFTSRNKAVGKVDWILAFGWEARPTGGTGQTLKLSSAPHQYIQISTINSRL